jgi:trk system potassium uptake protein TrkA
MPPCPHTPTPPCPHAPMPPCPHPPIPYNVPVMRIIVIGGGEIGYALSKALAAKHQVFVIDHDRAVGDRFGALDVQFVAGSGTSSSVLRRAHVDRADLCIACTGLDEVNIVACSIASGLGAKDTICFVSKEDFLRPLGDGDSLREQFGIGRVVWPEAQLADDIERIIGAPGAIDAEAFAGGQIRLLEYRLTEESTLVRVPIARLGLPRGSLIVAAMHEDRLVIPSGATRLEPGDKIIVMGHESAMKEVQARVNLGVERGRHLVTIIGGGDVGYRLAQRLDATPDIELRIIERDAARGEMLASQLRRALVLNGDGTDLELLETEQIGRSDVLVSVIDNDERNLLASLLGRQLGVRTIITRVGKPANLHLFERVGIDVAISARGAAVAAVVHRIQGGQAKMLAVIEEGQAHVLEIKVPAGYTPVALKDLDAKEAIVGAILREDSAIVPRGEDVIRGGDRLIVFARAESVDRVRDFFTGSPAR